MQSIKSLISAVLLSGTCLFGYSQAGDVQGIEINGTVRNASTGSPVNGASISSAGFSSSFSDSLGNFTIQVPHVGSELLISGPGMQTREIVLNGTGAITVVLHEEGFRSPDLPAELYYLQDPLVYTTQSIVSLNLSEDSWKRPGTSAEKILNNEVAGLRVLSRSGIPGIGSNLFIRGFSSLYSTNQPLIVLDGLIFETAQYGTPIINGFRTNLLNSININDIENVTLIRDASTLYGSRSGNGVLYIRTNHPDEMATRIDFSYYGGLNFAPEQIPLMQSEDYRAYVTEILQTSGISADSLQSLPFLNDDPTFPEYYRYHNETNWQDEVFSNSRHQNVNLKIQGGDDIALYALSVGYQNHQGIVRETDYSRYSFRFNSEINISSKLKLNTNLGFTFNQHNLKEDGDSYKTNPWHSSLIKAPFLYPNVRSSTGAISPNFEDADIFGVGNPAAMIRSLSATSNNYKILGSVDLGYRVSEHLNISNYLGINFDKTRDNIFIPYLGFADDTISQGIVGNQVAHKVERYFNVYNDLRARYIRTYNWRHHITGLAGARFGINKTQGDWGVDYNTPNDQIRSLGNGVSSMREVSGFFGDWNWITFYGRAGYDYNHKYLLNLDLALDGSSRFGKEADGLSMFGGVLGFFPAVSAAWIISSESFLANADFLDLLKIRLSYGITGNDNIGNYSALKFYTSQNLLGSQGLVKGNLYNPALQWETNKKLNGGIDISVFDQRLTIQADLYQNRIEDMINVIDADPLSGFDFYIDNNGTFTSTGFDLGFYGRILSGPILWDAGISLSKYRTELIEFPEDRRVTTLYGANVISRIGQPVNQFYGYRTQGVYATQAEADAAGLSALMPNTDLLPFGAGDMIFEDLNGDKVIDEQDMQVIGDPNPDLTGSLSSSVSWKGITLDLGLSFSYGNDVYNHLRHRLESMKNTDNQTLLVMNRWRGEGQKTEVPKATWGDPIGNSRFSDLYIEDGSYLRLSYISLSYRIPVKTGFLRSIELFASGQNLVTMTRYMGLDPDFSLSEATLAQGIDLGLTPQPRSVSMGIKIGL